MQILPPLPSIVEELASAETSDLRRLEVAVVRNITIEGLEPYLRYLGLQLGFDLEVRFGGYELVPGPGPADSPDFLTDSTDCVILFAHLEALSWPLARGYGSLSEADIKAAEEDVREHVAATLAAARQRTTAPLLCMAFEAPAYPALGIRESQQAAGQVASVLRLNEQLGELLAESEDAYLVDTNLCVARVGSSAFYDRRYWHMARAPYSIHGLAALARELQTYLRVLFADSKKCAVLDCDNTLWGGIVGEDGIDGIKLGEDHPGSPYVEFQQELLNLHNGGVILALCSKNNAADVEDVFKNHPAMLLREEHIAASRVNWEDKVTNLRRLSRDLNIGLDSMVFIDDSEFEIELIRRELPEVVAIHLPADHSVEYREILSSCGLFDRLSISDEDRRRGQMYRAEAERQRSREKVVDLEGYHRSLEMVATVRAADHISIPRVAQLTQRTNQFNLTTTRHSEADIRRLLDDERYQVFCVRYADKFGDSGTVGVCILDYESGDALIDTFLVSCRALGRGVEHVLLATVLDVARRRGCKRAVGIYRPTSKNAIAEDFYSAYGAVSADQDELGSELTFEFDLDVELPFPDYYASIERPTAEKAESDSGRT